MVSQSHVLLSRITIFVIIQGLTLKLPSLFAAWHFWTFHNKSYNMKALVLLSHSWSPFLPLTCLYGNNEFLWVSVQPSGYFRAKKLSQITHVNHMTITTRGQILSWPDYHKTKENVNIRLLDLCESLTVYIYSVHANESTWYPPDVR